MAFAYLPKNKKTWRIGYTHPVTGKQKTKSAKTRDPVLARKRARELTAAKTLNQLPDKLYNVPGPEKYTLSSLLAFYIASRQLKPATAQIYRFSVHSFHNVIPDKLIDKYTVKDFYLWRSSCSSRQVVIRKKIDNVIIPVNSGQTLSINSQATYARHLRSLFRFAIELDLIRKNPINQIRKEKKDIRIIPSDHLQLIFKTCKIMQEQNTDLLKSDLRKDHAFDNNYYDIVMLKFLGAYRISEVVLADVSHFKPYQNILIIPNQKGTKQLIPLVDDLRSHLESIAPESGLLFPRLTTDALRSFWRRLMKKLGFKYHVHQLRKTRGSQLANLGISPLFLRDFMRHESVTTTEQYYALIDTDKARIQINAMLKSNSKSDSVDSSAYEQ